MTYDEISIADKTERNEARIDSNTERLISASADFGTLIDDALAGFPIDVVALVNSLVDAQLVATTLVVEGAEKLADAEKTRDALNEFATTCFRAVSAIASDDEETGRLDRSFRDLSPSFRAAIVSTIFAIDRLRE